MNSSKTSLGKEYVLVLMHYDSDYEAFLTVRRVVETTAKRACIRAEERVAAGDDLLETVRVLIEGADLVIAEISKRNPNVFYELGYAERAQKKLLLLAKTSAKVPTNLKGKALIRYGIGTRSGTEKFERDLREQLQLRFGPQILLRDMLEARTPLPAYILSNPKFPSRRKDLRKAGVFDHRTFGDNLGISGLLSAFGWIMGEAEEVELISSQFCPPDLPKWDVSLYLIGSPKVNPVVASIMGKLQRGQDTIWRFGPAPGVRARGDYEVALYRANKGKERQLSTTPQLRRGRGGEKVKVFTRDYGIILRGPHPTRNNRLVMIMAGAHSVGTGAACLAATRSVLIQEIRAALPPGCDIADKSCKLWVLVKGKMTGSYGVLTPRDVTVEEAGVFS